MPRTLSTGSTTEVLTMKLSIVIYAAPLLLVTLLTPFTFAQPLTPQEQENKLLKEQLAILSQKLVMLDKQVSQLESGRSNPSTAGSQPVVPIPNPSPSAAPPPHKNWTNVEIWLSVGILVFGTIVLVLQTWLIYKSKAHWSSKSILRLNGLTLIITGALVLVTASYSTNEIAPVIGLLGSVAGYLLGSGNSNPQNAPTQPQQPHK